MNRIGPRLRLLREQLGLSQRELATRVGLGEQQVYRYESGHSDPYLTSAYALANELNVSIDYLSGLSDVPKPVILSLEESQLIDAWRRGDINFVLDKFAQKIEKYRDSRSAVTGA